MTKDETTNKAEKAEKKHEKKLVKTPKEVVEKKAETKAEEKTLDTNKETEKVEEPKKEIKKKEIPKIKKSEIIVRAQNIPLSAKTSGAICRFIVGKKINKAIEDLESVGKLKKAVPMRGEIPHRKGNIMSGRYPQKAAGNFIILLKSLAANANFNDMEEPIIAEAFANIGERPYGQFGRVRRKRAHIFIKAVEKNKLKNKIKGVLK